MCLFLILMVFSSRLAGLFWWAVNPNRWELAFNDSIIWPILGLIFLPFTTLMWVAVCPTGNPNGLDLLWVGVAVFIDLMNWAGGAAKRQDAPGYPSGY